ncbi:hypothetical protein BJX63DRAFT_402474 [Aspergillus granulosus]|uniref:Zn(2)-C6 fungal-type domain-containing protein n=1 Tax=Aspergillus granulosus TaxID=176169 RepID=A0ABR4H471_9EURO
MARLSGRSRGCGTCRQRRVKCDEQVPECSQCVRLGKKCPGAITSLIVLEATPVNPKKFRPLRGDESKSSYTPSAATGPPDADIVLGSGTLDPFFSTAVPHGSATNVYFQQFMLHTSKACYPFSPEMLSVWSFQEAMRQPAIHFGILSFTASHRYYLLREEGTCGETTDQHIQRSFEYRNQIIRITRASLAEVVLSASAIDSIATMIAWLLSIEAVNSNVTGMGMHVAGLMDFLRSIGGMDGLNHGTISFILGVDILSAIVRGTAPAVPWPQKWTAVAINHPAIRILSPVAGHYHPANLQRGIFRLIGTRFFNASWSRLLDRPLRIAVQNVCRLIIYYESDEQRPPKDKIANYSDNDPWMLSQRYLLYLSYDHLDLMDIREPIRRAILVNTMTRYCRFGVFPCLNTVATDLRNILVTRLEVFKAVAPDLLFWILYTGAMAARARKTGPLYRWYCDALATAAVQLALKDWNDTQPLLEQFLYVPRAADRLAEDIWRDVTVLRGR